MEGNASVRIVEVGPRDGLQNISTAIPTATKVELINRLHAAGLKTIEITSVVSPRAIPQLGDCQQLLKNADIVKLLHTTGLRLPVLIPNTKGFRIAHQHNVREVAVFVSASEGFSQANVNASVRQSLDRAQEVANDALGCGMAVRGYVSSVFSCPYDGATPYSAVLHCVRRLLDMGCYEISLGDTIGTGTPDDVRALLDFLVAAGVPIQRLAGHFHDTYGQAVGNVWAAYERGVRVFDSSIGGLGGCPYAPGAKGNVATEDLVNMFHQSNIDTGIHLNRLMETGEWVARTLSRPTKRRASSASTSKARQSFLQQPSHL